MPSELGDGGGGWAAAHGHLGTCVRRLSSLRLLPRAAGPQDLESVVGGGDSGTREFLVASLTTQMALAGP